MDNSFKDYFIQEMKFSQAMADGEKDPQMPNTTSKSAHRKTYGEPMFNIFGKMSNESGEGGY